MSARGMRVVAVCSEGWDTAEEGVGDYRWVVCCKKKKKKTVHMTPPPMDKKKRNNPKGKKQKQKKILVPGCKLAKFYCIFSWLYRCATAH